MLLIVPRKQKTSCKDVDPAVSPALVRVRLQVAKDAVVVEADAIKNKDVVYQQLNRRLSRMGRSTSDLSKYVHEYSTKAAESMFVAAINQQRVRV